jgi:hypothetical protein
MASHFIKPGKPERRQVNPIQHPGPQNVDHKTALTRLFNFVLSVILPNSRFNRFLRVPNLVILDLASFQETFYGPDHFRIGQFPLIKFARFTLESPKSLSLIPGNQNLVGTIDGFFLIPNDQFHIGVTTIAEDLRIYILGKKLTERQAHMLATK